MNPHTTKPAAASDTSTGLVPEDGSLVLVARKHARARRLHKPGNQSLPAYFTIHGIASPAVARTQLWSNMARIMTASTRGPISSLLQQLLAVPTSKTSRGYSLAFDALALAQLGTAYKQNDLLHQAVLSYCDAVRNLRMELMHAAATGVFPDELLVTPYLLFLGSLFATIASQEGSLSSLAHLCGLAYALQSVKKARSRLHLELLDALHQPLFILGLCLRKAFPVFMSRKEMEGLSKLPNHFAELTRSTMDLPALLERADEYPCMAPTLRREFELDLSIFDTKVRFWLERPTGLDEDGTELYQEVSVDKMPSFDAHLDFLSVTVFETGYRWRNLEYGWAHLRAWLSLLAIQMIRLDFVEMSDKSRGEAHLIGFQCADDICRTIACFIGTPSAGNEWFVAAAAAIPFVTRWYTARCDEKKMEWCAAVRAVCHAAGFTTLTDLSSSASRGALCA